MSYSRGGSGALYLQSAIARVMFIMRVMYVCMCSASGVEDLALRGAAA